MAPLRMPLLLLPSLRWSHFPRRLRLLLRMQVSTAARTLGCQSLSALRLCSQSVPVGCALL
jgi:hypothetical protein